VIRLQTEPIVLDELVTAVRGDGDGAVATFLGTVRDRSRGRRVVALEYEAYGGMAEREMERIAAEAVRLHGVSSVAIVHRTGRLTIGEASVAIAVSAAHRAEALDAVRFVIDTLKTTVPIWKREHFEDGATWVGEGS
jgi:molybdopterin synthase catalytic subunit